MMHSCIYEGRVRHRRSAPVEHHFEYPLFMVYLDLDELDEFFALHPLWSRERRNVASFDRAPHLGPRDTALKTAVLDLVQERTGEKPSGPVRLLTHLRYFGLRFNPVSFYYCFAEGGTRVHSIVAEVNNTPWGEQHCYVLGRESGRANGKTHDLDKVFHVSPFMSMNQRYAWTFTEPGRSLVVHMKTFEDGKSPFDATLTLQRRAATRRELTRVLVRYPLMTSRVVLAIYFEALRLHLKGAPFFDHPSAASDSGASDPTAESSDSSNEQLRAAP